MCTKFNSYLTYFFPIKKTFATSFATLALLIVNKKYSKQKRATDTDTATVLGFLYTYGICIRRQIKHGGNIVF